MSKLATFVEFSTDKELTTLYNEVKKNNLSVIGTSSESPLDEGEYTGTITGNKNRIVGKTGDNDWCIFLMEVKVKGGEFSGVLDRIPFNPTTNYKKNSVVKFEIYKDKNNLKRGKIVE